MVISTLVRGAGSPCIQSSSQPIVDLALVAVYHRDLARALEGVESSSDSGAGNILGLLIGSLSRANRFLVKSRDFRSNEEFSYLLLDFSESHSTLPLTFRALPKSNVSGGAHDAFWPPLRC